MPNIMLCTQHKKEKRLATARNPQSNAYEKTAFKTLYTVHEITMALQYSQ